MRAPLGEAGAFALGPPCKRAPRQAAGWLLGSLTVVGWLWLGELAGRDPGEPSGAGAMHSFFKKLSKNPLGKPS